LEHCREACEPAGVDWTLAARARELVTDMTGHLSSGGYKISLDRDELADRLIRTSKVPESDRHAERQARATLAQYVDDAASGSLETADGTISFEPLDVPDELDWLAVRRSVLLGGGIVRAGQWPWELDEEDTTGGALLGLRPVESVIEELRSMHFALEWLRMCELVRVTSTEPGKVMVSLNHDRFAAGLGGPDRSRSDRVKPSPGSRRSVARCWTGRVRRRRLSAALSPTFDGQIARSPGNSGAQPSSTAISVGRRSETVCSRGFRWSTACWTMLSFSIARSSASPARYPPT
jgi:hypothetical protein